MFHQKPLLGQQINWAHPLAKGLVGCWVMNERSGDKIYDLTNGAGFTAPNGLSWGPEGIDLESGSSQYVYVGTNSKYNLAGSITIIARLHWESAVSCRIISRFTSVAPNYHWELILYDTGRLRFYLGDSATHGEGVDTANGSVSAGQTFDVALRYYPSTGNMYVDGVDKKNGIGAQVLGFFPSAELSIGAQGPGTGNYFDGKIYYIYVFNDFLSLSTINAIQRNPYTIFEPEPIELMHAAAGPGGNAPTGTIYGPLFGPFAGPI